jgi:hypothetical protein
LNEINHAAANGLPFLALAMTVALPDICVTLAYGRTTAKLYKDWCNANLGKEFSIVTADDLYSLRCGLLHNGRFGDLKNNVARVIFALPGGATFVNCRINDAYFYSVVEFCSNFTKAVNLWFETNKTDAAIQANIVNLMQYRVGGLLPYVAGATVLA